MPAAPERPQGRALVSLGSNLTPERNLTHAVDLFARSLTVQAVSSAWATAPVGPPGQPEFLNAAALIATREPPLAFRDTLRRLEGALGRSRTVDRFAPRPIDLDLVAYDETTLDEEDLLLPDPDLLHQAYLAVPAAEIAPDWVHPHSGERLSEVAARLVAALPPAAQPRRTPLRLLGSQRADGTGGPGWR